MGLEDLEKKVADHYNKDHPQGQPQQAQQPAPPHQPQQQQQQREDKHHGADIAKRLGNATIFGAGASVGSNVVNGIIH